MNVSLKLEGIDEVTRNLNKAIAGIRGDIRKGLIEGALIILRQSQKYSPVLTGNLKAGETIIYSTSTPQEPAWDTKGNTAQLSAAWNGMVNESRAETQKDERKGEDSVIIGCGAFYSVFVHERHPNPQKRKFLERAMREKSDEVVERIRRRAVIA